jgi:predicted metalloprotease with PDZ domain
MPRFTAFAIFLSSISTVSAAQTVASHVDPAGNSRPTPVEPVDTVPAARDVAFPGTLTLDVDTSDNLRGIFRVRETIPVTAAGDLVLLYPKWLPGVHSAAGAIQQAAGFRFTSDGRTLTWKRDPVDVTAFHVIVPSGVRAVTAEFQYLSPTEGDQGGILSTSALQRIEWVSLALYPAGYFVRDIPVNASLTIPAGWQMATALRPVAPTQGGRTVFQAVDFDTLMDSPVIAGSYFRRIELSPKVALDVAADGPSDLAATPEQIDAHRRLVEQARKLFGAEHYDHYDFLFTISDNLGGEGLEHHRSSEDGVGRGYFTEWNDALRDRNLLPHEFTHSWNGKFRRPADLWTPDYRTPMRDSLLWVYEGQTEFWGYVLGARSGMLSKRDTLDAIASVAAYYANNPGRTWRALEDTTNDPIVAARQPQAWNSWQRSEDYYSEGQLIWIDVDRIIRQQSHGKRSINDFARAFFGLRDGDWGEVTYTFDDVVAILSAIQPYDWRTYLTARIKDTAPNAPLDGILKGGYRLVYQDHPTPWIESREKHRKFSDFTYSLGFAVDKDAKIISVLWDSPAFSQQLTVGTKIVAINGHGFDPDGLEQAIRDAAAPHGPPISLIVEQEDNFRTVVIDWRGGLRYPTLEKIGSSPSTLDALLAPLP